MSFVISTISLKVSIMALISQPYIPMENIFERIYLFV